jgi:hypothetical protein
MRAQESGYCKDVFARASSSCVMGRRMEGCWTGGRVD